MKAVRSQQARWAVEKALQPAGTGRHAATGAYCLKGHVRWTADGIHSACLP